MCGLGNFVILASKKCLVETEVLGQVTPKRVLTEMKLESGKQKGVAVQTEFIHSGSFVRIADGWFATSNWPIVKVNVGDEIAMFTKSTKSDSFIVGVVAAVIPHEGTKPKRCTIIFWHKPELAVKRKVIASRGDHYYEIKASNYL